MYQMKTTKIIQLTWQMVKLQFIKLCYLLGVINSFLSWGFFLPLARISYMAYLIHYEVLMVFYNSADYAMEMDNLLIVSTQLLKIFKWHNLSFMVVLIIFVFNWFQSQYFIALIIITYALSYVASLAFEAPFLGIEKIVMGGNPWN